ncbi:hypothetical protein FRC10_011510 [Ceratobasidium sp. 414]|nr:hypothetical protein FRC10_011510 [Ceratobasidium sp. 414]
MSKCSNNKACAKYRTGYRDAQCPKNIKFINGKRDGRLGGQLDRHRLHPPPLLRHWPDPLLRLGVHQLLRPARMRLQLVPHGRQVVHSKGLTVDTAKKMTVVTQFITDTNTAAGKLVEIRRLSSKTQNSKTNIPGMSPYDSITDNFCSAQKTAFNDQNVYASKGRMTTIDKSFTNGVVLVMSIWDDHAANMLWLDSSYLVDADPSAPGITRGTCATTSGKPTDVETNSPNASVTFSNIRFGGIGSTYSGTGTNPTATTTSAPGSTPTSPSGAVPRYGQCGGNGYTGPTT